MLGITQLFSAGLFCVILENMVLQGGSLLVILEFTGLEQRPRNIGPDTSMEPSRAASGLQMRSWPIFAPVSYRTKGMRSIESMNNSLWNWRIMKIIESQ